MEVRYLGFAVVAALIASTMFFSVSLEGQAGEQMIPHHLYKLQYSYDGETWHDLITIEDGVLSENKRYLRQNGRFPCLRYSHSYLDEEGTQRLDYIPLTVGGISARECGNARNDTGRITGVAKRIMRANDKKKSS